MRSLVALFVLLLPIAGAAQAKKTAPPPKPAPAEPEVEFEPLLPLAPAEPEKPKEPEKPAAPLAKPAKVRTIEAVTPVAPPEVKAEAPVPAAPPPPRFALASEVRLGWTTEAESGDRELTARFGVRGGWLPMDRLELGAGAAFSSYRAAQFSPDFALGGPARHPADVQRWDAQLGAAFVSPELGKIVLKAGGAARFVSFASALDLALLGGLTLGASARLALSEVMAAQVDAAWTYNLLFAGRPTADPVGGPVALTEFGATLAFAGPFRVGYRGEVVAFQHSYRFFHALQAGVHAEF